MKAAEGEQNELGSPQEIEREAIDLRTKYEALKLERDALKAQVERLDWQPITPENLPKVGDEVLYFLDDTQTLPRVPHVYELLSEWGMGDGNGKRKWFRPINPPARTAPAKETE